MKYIKQKIKAIIFDMDGTIIDSEGIWQQITIDAIKDEGIKLNDENIEILKSCYTANLYDLTRNIITKFKLKTSPENLVAKKISLSERYFKHATEKEIKFLKGFKNFHKKLHKYSIETSVATNSGISVLNHITKNLKLDSFFGNNIYSAEHANNKHKPDPAVFLHAVDQLNVKPQECIIFEDSKEGFMAAKAANIKCIAIKNEPFKKYLKLADYIINDYDEAIDAIKKII